MKVLIVGGGIVGLSTAWALARLDHIPVVYDQGAVPNPMAASYDQHRIIRLAYGERDGYCRMVKPAFQAWQKLWHDLGEQHYVETGTLLIGGNAADYATLSRASFDRLNMPYDELDMATVAKLCPFLTLGSDAWGLYNTEGGVLLADRIVDALAVWLRNQGIEIHPLTMVQGADFHNAIITLSDDRQHEADALVVAVGAWAPQLLPELAAKVKPTRQAVVYLEPPAHYLQSWRNSPVIVDFGGTDDAWAIPPVANTGLKIGVHSHQRPGDPSSPRTLATGEPVQVLAYFENYFEDFHRYEVIEGRVCYYGWSIDECFVVNTTKRAVAITGCSGHMFKFGALLGLELAGLVTGERDQEDFTRWIRGKATDG
ncbi:MAG: NAD(P)/FAD-dependent oxidoreductase [Acidiferrobacterales bacterium]